LNNCIKERIISGDCEPAPDSPKGVVLRRFAAETVGAKQFSTGMATFDAAAQLPYHIHDVSEAVTILEGSARVFVEGREYTLSLFDCIHIPAGTAHAMSNVASELPMRAHSAFGASRPLREFVQNRFSRAARESADPLPKDPETIVRFEKCPEYELSPGALFRDLFARRLGSVGICGGYGRFSPGASLPCHVHSYDESITIVTGEAKCLVRGSQYHLSAYDTAFVPEGQPHRFINGSNSTMAMIWVYAGGEPDRLIVNSDYCSGVMVWPGQ
jgi:quercetin dioxygenase-like cupin family protein